MELIRQSFCEEPDIQKITSLVQKDPTLTAKLFQTVNSAAFGLRSEVKSVQQAISIIGLDALRSSVVSLALGDYFINSSFGNALDPKKFTTHSLATAVIMQKIAEHLKVKGADNLYLIGLLHDLGKLVLDILPTGEYSEVIWHVEGGTSYEEAEKKIFGMDNREVWKELATSWNFPIEITNLYEGTLDESSKTKTRALIQTASSMADTLGYSFTNPAYRDPSEEAGAFSTMNDEVMVEIGKSAETEVGALCEVLNLPTPDSDQVKNTLLRISRQLSTTNTKYIKIRNELELRVETLENLTKVFTGIIRTVDGESLSFSVIEALIDGFNLDSALMLVKDCSGGISGYVARNDKIGDADIEQVRVERSQISSEMESSIENSVPVKMIDAGEKDVLVKLLGDAPLAWFAPIYVKKRFMAVIGMGVRDENNKMVQADDFKKIIEIISGEIGLSMDNTRLYKRMRREARVDALTNIFNRRTIMKVLASEFARFKRKPTPFSLAIFDVDNFKSINDTRGHQAGDEFLVSVSKILRAGMRDSDHIGRYGGDEFIAVFPDTEPGDAKIVVERIREKILDYCKSFEGPDLAKKLSVSIGVAGANESTSGGEELLKDADEALYMAKELGRDRCVVFEEAMAVK